MGLLNGNVGQAQAQAQDVPKKAQAKAEKREALAKVLEWAKANGSDEIKALVEKVEKKRGGGGGSDVLFAKAFPNATVGMKITAFEMFERCDKNIKTFVKKCEEWKSAGKHEVKYDAASKTFEIVKL